MKELVFVKVPAAVVVTFLPVYLYQLGFTKYQIGILNAVSTIATLISSFYFSYKALEYEDSRKIIMSSLSVISFSILAYIYLKDFNYFLLATFLFSFYTSSFVYFLKVYYTRSGRDVKEIQSRFEFYGGVYWLIGLLAAALISMFLETRYLFLFAFFVSIFGLLTFYIKGKPKRKPLLLLIDEFSETVDKDIVESTVKLREIKFRRSLPLHIFVMVYAISLRLFESQFSVFLKSIGFSLSAIFMISFAKSLMDAIAYKIARRLPYNFIYILPFFVSFLVFTCSFVDPLLMIFLYALYGIPRGSSFVLLDSYFLEKRREEFGTNILLRTIASSFGDYLCGLLLTTFSFFDVFRMSGILAAVSPFILLSLQKTYKGEME